MAEGFVVLRCFDGAQLRVPSALLRQSCTVMDAAEVGEGGAAPVPGRVTGRVLATVVDYWKRRAKACAHGDAAAAEYFDGAFVAGLSHDERVDLINAAAMLGAHQLFDLFAAHSRGALARRAGHEETYRSKLS